MANFSNPRPFQLTFEADAAKNSADRHAPDERKTKLLLELDTLQKYQQRYLRLAQARQPQVENSLLFRLMVQLMGSMAILAIDLSTSTHQSYIWIGLAAIGGTGSWLLRHHRRHILVICGVLGWLTAMFCIFRAMTGQSASSTAILPNLAMGILAALPIFWITRQNLGFAIFLSWITTAIVSTIETTPLTIAALLTISLFALPTLWLEYRSRIGLPPLPWNWQARQLKAVPWRYLIQMGAIAILASLILSAFLGAIPPLKLPELPRLMNNPTVNSMTDAAQQTLRQRTREFENSYQPNNQEPPPIPTATADSSQFAQQQNVSDYAKTMETKYEQLPPEHQAQLQAQTQEIIQYQRHLEGNTTVGSTTEQAQALATFLQNHAQPANPAADRTAPAPANLINNLSTSCPQPQSCQVPGSSAQLHETYAIMARSVDIPAAVAKEQGAEKLDMASSSIGPAADRADLTTPPESQPKPQHFNFLRLLVFLVAGIVVACCYLWFRNEQQRQTYRRRFASLPPLEQIYRQMLKQLQQKGVSTKRAAQSPEEYAAVIQAKLPPTSARLVSRISQAYTAWRYGHEPTNVDLMQKLLQELITDLQPKKN